MGWVTRDEKISWVRWLDVCNPKSEGNFWVRDLQIVNASVSRHRLHFGGRTCVV